MSKHNTSDYQSSNAADQRSDAGLLNALEGVLRDGFSLSSLGRLAQASGSSFWLGAAIGAGLVVAAKQPEVRQSVAELLHAAKAKKTDHD